jgi:hypothetical protein
MPRLSIRGKAFRVQQGDDETVIKDGDDNNLQRLRVVIIAARDALNKAYYEGAWTGTKQDAACFSLDGVRPNPGVPNQQNDICATCIKNAFGTSSNGKGKACSDAKKIIVVPINDLGNGSAELAQWQGDTTPFTMSVPAGSFKTWKSYVTTLAANKVPMRAAVTELSFADTEYPSLEFKYAGLMTAEAFAEIEDLRATEQVVKSISTDPVDLSKEDDEVVEPKKKKPKKQAKVEEPDEDALPSTTPEEALSDWD